MARIVTYTFIFTGLAMLLYLSGIQSAGTSALLSGFGITMNNAGIAISRTASIISALLTILAIGASIGAIIIGFFIRQSTESAIIAPAAAALASVMIGEISATIAYFFAYTPATIAWIMALIFVPMLTTYVVSIVQWWRGSDI